MIFDLIWGYYGAGLRAIYRQRGQEGQVKGFSGQSGKDGAGTVGSWSFRSLKGQGALNVLGQIVSFARSFGVDDSISNLEEPQGQTSEKVIEFVEGSSGVLGRGEDERREMFLRSRFKTGGGEEISGDQNFLGNG
ncbi:MAG: hypothetical protein ACXABY_29940, partial [Candidatus Thorarchaeota archaeon]